MEQVREEVNIGKAIDVEKGPEKEETPRQPVKKFIGRKSAAAIAQKRAEAGGHIEDSGAIQGFLGWTEPTCTIQLTRRSSCDTKKDCKSVESDTVRYPGQYGYQRCHRSFTVELLF